MSSIQDTFEWCGTCGLVDQLKKITNCGGDCCQLKKKRAYGEPCGYWIRRSEEQERAYARYTEARKK